MRILTDEELIQKALSGDRSGFTALVNRYKGMSFSLAYRLVGNRENAEEIAQDAFIKVFRALPGFRFESKFSSWLYRIVYTTAMTYLRKKTISTHELSEEIQEVFGEDEDYSLRFDQKIHKEMVQKVLNLLSPEDSSLMHLYYILEQSLAEIEGISGVPEETLKVRLFRARKKCRGLLEKELVAYGK